GEGKRERRAGGEEGGCGGPTRRHAHSGGKKSVPPRRAARQGIVLGRGRLPTCRRTAWKPPQTLTQCTRAQISVDALARRGQKMWKQAGRTLAPDSRHIVAFPSSNTTLRAADSHSVNRWRGYASGQLVVAQARSGILSGLLRRGDWRGIAA